MQSEFAKRTKFIFRFYWLAVIVLVLYAVIVAWQRNDGQIGIGMVAHGAWAYFTVLATLSALSLVAGHLGLAIALLFKTPQPEIYYGISWVLFALMAGAVWWFFYTSTPPLRIDLLSLIWFLVFFYLLNVPRFERFAQNFYDDSQGMING